MRRSVARQRTFFLSSLPPHLYLWPQLPLQLPGKSPQTQGLIGHHLPVTHSGTTAGGNSTLCPQRLLYSPSFSALNVFLNSYVSLLERTGVALESWVPEQRGT